MYERQFPVHLTPNMYNSDVLTHTVSFTDTHPLNTVISLYGVLFLALDWSFSGNNTLVFETFRECLDHSRVSVLTATPDNSNLLLYSVESNTMTYVYRDKESEEEVMEDWTEVNLGALPSDMQGKRILGLMLKKEDMAFVVWESGIVASVRVEGVRDEYIAALVWLDDDFFYGILIPTFFALIATASIYLKRRLNSQANNQMVAPQPSMNDNMRLDLPRPP